MKTFWYVATPYSKYPGGLDAAFAGAAQAAATLVRAGVPICCPITHTHPISEAGRFDGRDLDVWLRVDKPFIDLAHGIIVVAAMDGWRESAGIRQEIADFEASGKPVVYMSRMDEAPDLSAYA